MSLAEPNGQFIGLDDDDDDGDDVDGLHKGCLPSCLRFILIFAFDFC